MINFKEVAVVGGVGVVLAAILRGTIRRMPLAAAAGLYALGYFAHQRGWLKRTIYMLPGPSMAQPAMSPAGPTVIDVSDDAY